MRKSLDDEGEEYLVRVVGEEHGRPGLAVAMRGKVGDDLGLSQVARLGHAVDAPVDADEDPVGTGWAERA